MGAKGARPLVLDAGALIAVERDQASVRALLHVASQSDARLIVPATVAAQVLRNGATQSRLWRLLLSPSATVVPLDFTAARGVGVICGMSKTHDIVDANVVLVARQFRCAVVTSDAKDLRRIDPHLELHEI